MGVFVNSGIGAQVIMAPETTYGVAPALTAAEAIEFNSETLAGKKNIIQGKGLHSGGLHNRGARRIVSTWTAGGGVNIDLPTRYINQLLMQMFGSKGQAKSALTQDATTGAYSAVHAPGSLLGTSMCIQKGVPSVDGTVANPFTYVGMKMTDWEISVQADQIAKLATNWDGRNELAAGGNGDPLNASVPVLGPYTDAATNGVFHFREATLYTGGTVSTATGVTTVTGNTALGNVKSAKVKYGFHLDTTRYFLGSKGFKAEQIEDDYRDISGEFVIEWLNSEAQYTAYLADTPTCLVLDFVGTPIGSGTDHQELQIMIPQIFLDGEPPKVGGPKVVTQTVPFTGLDDGANNTIQALYWTLDTV